MRPYAKEKRKESPFMELLETLLHSFVNLAMLLFEYIGVGVITYAGIQGLVNYVRKAPDTRLVLAQGLAMGLEFKLGSEILRTVVVRSLSEIAIVGSIIALRAVLTILIHWEIKNEVNEKQMPGAAQAAAAEDTDAAAIPSTPKNDSENVVPVENTDTDASTDEAKASNSSDNAETNTSVKSSDTANDISDSSDDETSKNSGTTGTDNDPKSSTDTVAKDPQ